MKTFPAIILILALSAFHLAAGPYTPEDTIQTSGDWSIVTITLLQGTKSQITLGKLKYKKSEIIGEVGHLLVTPLGHFIWRGSYDRGYMRGWILIDPDTDTKGAFPAELPETTLGGLYYSKKKG